jgi:eukaryotic-like serine/threonine-protein kinase
MAPASPNLMWSYATGAQVYSSPAVDNGMVIIASWDGNAYGFNEFSGRLMWTYSTGAPIFGSPAVANGIVYVGSKNGIMYALNEQTGSMIWEAGNPNYAITSSPLVANGKVFYGNWCQASLCAPGNFVALDANTGAFVWISAANDHVISSPSVDNGLVFFGVNDGSIVALNETNGKGVWSTTPISPMVIPSAPAVANGRVFVGTGDRFVALNEQSGAIDWTYNTGGSNATSGAVSGGMVYFGTGVGRVYAVNATTGIRKWSTATGAAINSSPAFSLGSNALLVGSNDKYLYEFNAATGVRIWRYLTGAPIWSSPAVADGRVFFGSQDYSVYGLGVIAPQLHVSVSSAKASLKPGQFSTLTITVTNGTSPEAANLTLTSSAGGTFSVPVQESVGVYASNYTSPVIAFTTIATLQAVGSKTGYVDGTGQTTVTLIPFPTLTVFMFADPTTVSPGGESVLKIAVENGTTPISGANVSATSSQGGTFSTVTDKGNGNYTVIFWAGGPNSNPTISVQASKPNFATGRAQFTITVSGDSWLNGVSYQGVPLYWFLVVVVVLGVAILATVAKWKKESVSEHEANVPNYALGRFESPGRLN